MRKNCRSRIRSGRPRLGIMRNSPNRHNLLLYIGYITVQSRLFVFIG